MIHDKFVISDTHLFHTNILKFKDDAGKRYRPFNDLTEMHEIIIRKWNDVVGDNDFVYHLGDVTFQYHKGFNELMSQLKGQKRLIVGNHDKIWNPTLMRWFQKADLWKGFKEYNFTMSHMPLREGHFRDGEFNVHGHLHQNLVKNKDGSENLKYINVSVEQTDYAPVPFDILIEEINERNRKLNS